MTGRNVSGAGFMVLQKKTRKVSWEAAEYLTNFAAELIV